MTTTPIPSPEAEALPTLPVVAWQDHDWVQAERPVDACSEFHRWQPLTPHAPAEAAIVALRDDRDSWCQQASARTEDAVRFAAERDALRAEVAELRKDAQRYRCLRSNRSALTTDGRQVEVDVFDEDGSLLFDEQLDAAVDRLDAARASLLGDGGTL